MNGGTCERKVKNGKVAFKCNCLFGFFGADCTKIVNFCKTGPDGIKPITNPCKTDPLISSCAPTTALITIDEPDESLNPFRDLQITLAGYVCLQADKIGTCGADRGTNPNIFDYACSILDNPDYVY